MSLPEAIAAPRASQRNTATTLAEPAFYNSALAQQLTSQYGEQFTEVTGPVLPLDQYIGSATGIALPARRALPGRSRAGTTRRRQRAGGQSRIRRAAPRGCSLPREAEPATSTLRRSGRVMQQCAERSGVAAGGGGPETSPDPVVGMPAAARDQGDGHGEDGAPNQRAGRDPDGEREPGCRRPQRRPGCPARCCCCEPPNAAVSGSRVQVARTPSPTAATEKTPKISAIFIMSQRSGLTDGSRPGGGCLCDVRTPSRGSGGGHAAAGYSLIRPPSTAWRVTRWAGRPGMGWSGLAGRRWRLRCGRRWL